MKILYLGTGAYEGIPTVFCNCYACQQSRMLGGKNIRSRAQALINNDLLLDFGPDTVYHTQKYKLDWSKIHYCLITHTHSDHFYVEDLEILFDSYSHLDNKRFNLYGGTTLTEIINKTFWHPKAKEELNKHSKVEIVKEGDILEFDGYRVLVLNANHDRKSSPRMYAIEKDNKKILYAHDTGEFLKSNYDLLKEFGRLDLISIDCTGCNLPDWRDHHLSYNIVKEVIGKLQNMGIIDEKTIKVINHFSHNGGATYNDLVELTKDDGFIVAYDGLEIEL